MDISLRTCRRFCLLGASISTWDFVLSQCSGNAALMLWMLASAVWAYRQKPLIRKPLVWLPIDLRRDTRHAVL